MKRREFKLASQPNNRGICCAVAAYQHLAGVQSADRLQEPQLGGSSPIQLND